MNQKIVVNIATIAIALLSNQNPNLNFSMRRYALDAALKEPDPCDILNNNFEGSVCFFGFGPFALGPTAHKNWVEYRHALTLTNPKDSFSDETKEEEKISTFIGSACWGDYPENNTRQQAARRALFALESPGSVPDCVPSAYPLYYCHLTDAEVLLRLEHYKHHNS